MKTKNDSTTSTGPGRPAAPAGSGERITYEPPRIVSKRSLERVTLASGFVGGGNSSGGSFGTP